MLTFDPQKHEYRWNGEIVPHVTGIISDLTDYSKIPADKLAIAIQKGNAVHRMVQLDAANDLDFDAMPQWMKPIHIRWRQFLDDTDFKIALSEFQVYHPKLRYAGTLDLYGEFPTRVGQQYSDAYIDVKRSFFAGAAIGLQLVAYQAADYAQNKRGKKAKRFALRLNENGPYRLEPFEDPDDFDVFTACLIRHKWMEKNT